MPDYTWIKTVLEDLERQNVEMSFLQNREPLQLVRSLPLSYIPNLVWAEKASYSYENGYLKQVSPVGYPAFMTGHSLQRYPSALQASASGYASDTNMFVFWYEPHKGNWDNFQGFVHNAANYSPGCVSRASAVATYTAYSFDVTTENIYSIRHEYDQSEIKFGFQDGLDETPTWVVTHTTNVSAQPYEICFGEPNNVARTSYLRYPPGIYLTYV